MRVSAAQVLCLSDGIGARGGNFVVRLSDGPANRDNAFELSSSLKV